MRVQARLERRQRVLKEARHQITRTRSDPAGGWSLTFETYLGFRADWRRASLPCPTGISLSVAPADMYPLQAGVKGRNALEARGQCLTKAGYAHIAFMGLSAAQSCMS